jgi:hypothetical protein
MRRIILYGVFEIVLVNDSSPHYFFLKGVKYGTNDQVGKEGTACQIEKEPPLIILIQKERWTLEGKNDQL